MPQISYKFIFYLKTVITEEKNWMYGFSPIHDGGGQKGPPTSFSPVASINARFGPQNFLTFSCNPFSTLVQNFKLVPSASPNILNLNQDHPSKKAIFLVKSL